MPRLASRIPSGVKIDYSVELALSEEEGGFSVRIGKVHGGTVGVVAAHVDEAWNCRQHQPRFSTQIDTVLGSLRNDVAGVVLRGRLYVVGVARKLIGVVEPQRQPLRKGLGRFQLDTFGSCSSDIGGLKHAGLRIELVSLHVAIVGNEGRRVRLKAAVGGQVLSTELITPHCLGLERRSKVLRDDRTLFSEVG